MSVNRKIAPISATAAWCIDHCDGLRRMGLEFDAALGYDFMHLCLFRDGVKWW